MPSSGYGGVLITTWSKSAAFRHVDARSTIHTYPMAESRTLAIIVKKLGAKEYDILSQYDSAADKPSLKSLEDWQDISTCDFVPQRGRHDHEAQIEPLVR